MQNLKTCMSKLCVAPITVINFARFHSRYLENTKPQAKNMC